jgi:hypothetical protein
MPTLPLRAIFDRAQAAGRRAPDLLDFAEAFGADLAPAVAVVTMDAPPVALPANVPLPSAEEA